MATMNGAAYAAFVVRLSEPNATAINVAWRTEDGTGHAGTDYKASSGTVTFPPGVVEQSIQVEVYGRSPQDSTEDRTFLIRLDPPIEAILENATAECVITVVTLDGATFTQVYLPAGPQGRPGVGNTGLNAYELAKLNGYVGTLAQWLQTVTGRSIELINDGTWIKWRPQSTEDPQPWQNLVQLSTLKGAPGTNGADGKQVQLQKTSTAIQWRLEGGAWADLVQLSDLKGDKGDSLVNRGNWVTGTTYQPGSYVAALSSVSTTAKSLWFLLDSVPYLSTTAPKTDLSHWLELQPPQGPKGDDGRKLEMQAVGSTIQYRYEGDTTWSNLITIPSASSYATPAADLNSVTPNDQFAWNASTANLPVAGTTGRGFSLNTDENNATQYAIVNATGVAYVRFLTSGSWGAWTKTGASSATDIGAFPNRGTLGAAADINTFGPTTDFYGFWYIGSASAAGSPNLPEANQGILEVFNGGRFGGTQRYTTYLGTEYVRSLTASWNASSPSWGPWILIGDQPVQAWVNGDLNAVVTPGTYSVTTTATNAPSGWAYSGILEVKVRISTNTLFQRLTMISSVNGNIGRVFQRQCNSGTWSAWTEPALYGDSSALNLIRNSQFLLGGYLPVFGSGATATLEFVASTDSRVPAGAPSINVGVLTKNSTGALHSVPFGSVNDLRSNYIGVTPGEIIDVSIWVAATGITAGQQLRLVLSTYNGTTLVTNQRVANYDTTITGWRLIKYSYQVPSGVNQIVMGLWSETTAPAGSVAFFSSPTFMKRVMPLSAPLSGTVDLNTLTDAGIFSCTAWSNAPSTLTGTLAFVENVVSVDLSGVRSITQTLTSRDTNAQYRRSYTGTAWSAWDEVVTTSSSRLPVYQAALGINPTFLTAVSDLNTALANSHFAWSDTSTNSPVAGTYGRGITIASSATDATQIGMINATGKRYIRFMASGTWGAWQDMDLLPVLPFLNYNNVGTFPFPAGAYTAIPFYTSVENNGITNTSNTTFTVAAAGLYDFEVEIRVNGGATNMPPVGTIIGISIDAASTPTLLRVGYSAAQAIDATTIMRLNCRERLAAGAVRKVYLFNGGSASYQIASASIKITRVGA